MGREIADPTPGTELASTGAETNGGDRGPVNAVCDGSTVGDALETEREAETSGGMESDTAADPAADPLMREMGMPLLGLVALLSEIVDTGPEGRIN